MVWRDRGFHSFLVIELLSDFMFGLSLESYSVGEIHFDDTLVLGFLISSFDGVED